jgi:hypothetical protein
LSLVPAGKVGLAGQAIPAQGGPAVQVVPAADSASKLVPALVDRTTVPLAPTAMIFVPEEFRATSKRSSVVGLVRILGYFMISPPWPTTQTWEEVKARTPKRSAVTPGRDRSIRDEPLNWKIAPSSPTSQARSGRTQSLSLKSGRTGGGVKVRVGVGVRVKVNVALSVGVGLAVRLGVRVRESVGVADSVGLGVKLTVSVFVGRSV